MARKDASSSSPSSPPGSSSSRPSRSPVIRVGSSISDSVAAAAAAAASDSNDDDGRRRAPHPRRRGGKGRDRDSSSHVVVPLTKRPLFRRLDSLPFFVVYAFLVGTDAVCATRRNVRSIVTVLMATMLVAQICLALVQRWRVRVRSFVGYKRCPPLDDGKRRAEKKDDDDERRNDDEEEERRRRCNEMRRWTHCLVVPPSHDGGGGSGGGGGGGSGSGSPGIVPVVVRGVSPAGGGGGGSSSAAAATVVVAVAKFRDVTFRATSAPDGVDDEMDGLWIEGGGGVGANDDDEDVDASDARPAEGEAAATSSGSSAIGASSEKGAAVDARGGSSGPPRGGGGRDLRSPLLSPSFHVLRYPADLPLSFYADHVGHETLSALSRAESVYGTNETRISDPPFLSLLSEQLTAPFFLFQLLCVVLWSLDEYWYYALFTLATLVLFECTVSYNRLKSLQRLRETLRKPYRVWAYRCGLWGAVGTDELVAGDVVSLTSSSSSQQDERSGRRWGLEEEEEEGERRVPADALLLRGTAVVDESALTGESVPQLKESLDFASSSASEEEEEGEVEERLDAGEGGAGGEHRRSVLFGGTALVDHHRAPAPAPSSSSFAPPPPTGGDDDEEDDRRRRRRRVDSIPAPPDDGLVAVVLRTGFDTSQGSLLRTMVHSAVSSSSSSSDVDGRDTFLFLLLLLLCALGSAVAVLRHGWHDETRNRFKLVLHVVIIVTSVVPPELPMELSLAVTSSLTALAKSCGVFCTEPFRIPLAGRVDVCAFDKTGTLTSDDVRLRRVRPAPGTRGGTIVSTGNAGGDDDDDGPRSGDGKTGRDPSGNAALPWETTRIMAGCHSLALANRGGVRGRRRRGSSSAGAAPHGRLVGDPTERAVFESTGFELRRGDVAVSPPPRSDGPPGGEQRRINVRHRFAFSSKLKRMTVLVTEGGVGGAGGASTGGRNDGGGAAREDVWALSKGAPETIKSLLNPATVPPDYDDACASDMARGRRVLAMGYRNLGRAVSVATWKERGRDAVERDLIFGGFLVLDCPLKPDSKDVVKELKGSGHRVLMITGDAVLTAAEVARQVGIVDGKGLTYELKEMSVGGGRGGGDDSDCAENGRTATAAPGEAGRGSTAAPTTDGTFAFVPLTSGDARTEECIAFVPSNVAILEDMSKKSEASFCVSGDVLFRIAASAVLSESRRQGEGSERRHCRGDLPTTTTAIDEKSVLLDPAARSALASVVSIANVYARHAPRQKEAVIGALNALGRHTLMCGDGTNDVGALKRAHVGVSIVSVPEVEAKQREAAETLGRIGAEERSERKARRRRAARGDGDGRKKKSASAVASERTKKKERAFNLEESIRKLREAEEELSHVALGDASVASPFTSRAVSVKCCKDVLRQGRCTLVTMLQIYKILGVNCLVNALVLTKLHMRGAKQGDRQLTVVGVVVAALFLFVTKGKPLETLSPARPPPSVLCVQALLSISVQFSIHLAAITAVTALSLSYVDPYDPGIVPDGPFNPNVLNTCAFLVTVLATVNAFVTNYRGRPFTEDLSENKWLARSAWGCYAVLFGCALEVFPPLNQLLQLAPLPSGGVRGGDDRDDAAASNFVDGGVDDGPSAALSGMVDALGFRGTLCLLMAADSAISYKAEKWIVRWFEG